MKVARKTPPKRLAAAPPRATLTLPIETYRQIDSLRGAESRSAWLQGLIAREAEARERQRFASLLGEQYTPAVCRETLAVNDQFPVHET